MQVVTEQELRNTEQELEGLRASLASTTTELESLRAHAVKLQSQNDVLESALKQAVEREQNAAQAASQARTDRSAAEKARALAVAEAEAARADAEKAYGLAVKVEQERYQGVLKEVYRSVGSLIV